MQNKIEWILFDCMETLVDMTELPLPRDYAAWAYYGSGTEKLFGSFEEFYILYDKAKKTIDSSLEKYHEYEFSRRLQLAAQYVSGNNLDENEQTRELLYSNYWKNYSDRCYVRQDILETLPSLKKEYRLGVVSNFMVSGGIEELLEANGIKDYFDFVVTSIREGWRKPHINIYDAALKLSGSGYEKILFVGDDYENDYSTPETLGMSSVLLDRYGRYKETKRRIADFYELRALLKGL